MVEMNTSSELLGRGVYCMDIKRGGSPLNLIARVPERGVSFEATCVRVVHDRETDI